jgi:hypothetical protein
MRTLPWVALIVQIVAVPIVAVPRSREHEARLAKSAAAGAISRVVP